MNAHEHCHATYIQPVARITLARLEGAGQRVRHRGVTRFVMAVEPGEGDSVEKYAKLWDGMTLEAVHHETLQAEERGEIVP